MGRPFLRFHHLVQSLQHRLRSLRRKHAFFPVRSLLALRQVRPHHVSAIDQSGIHGRQVERIHQKLSLSVTAVRQIHIGSNLPLCPEGGGCQFKIKGQLFSKAQGIQTFRKAFRSQPHGRLGKINIIRMHQRVFQILDWIVFQSRHIVAAPALVQLPGKSVVFHILLRIQGACRQSQRRRHRLKGGARNPGCQPAVIQGLRLVRIDRLPGACGIAHHKIIRIVGRRTYQSQHRSALRIHGHGAALVSLHLLVEVLLQSNVHGKDHVFSILRRFLQKRLLHIALLIQNLDGIAVPGAQLLLVDPLGSCLSDDAVLVVALSGPLLQLLGRDILHIACKLGRLFPKWIKAHRRIRDHHARDLQQLLLQIHGVLGHRAQGHKGIVPHPAGA